MGLGKLTPDDVIMILNARGRTETCVKQPYKAPARGLCLDYCFYDRLDDDDDDRFVSDTDTYDCNDIISKATVIGSNNEKRDDLERSSHAGEEGEDKEGCDGDGDSERELRGVGEMQGDSEVGNRRLSLMSNLNSVESEEDSSHGMESEDDDYDDDVVISEEVIPVLGPVLQHFSLKKIVRYDDGESPKSPKLFRPLERLIEGGIGHRKTGSDVSTAFKNLSLSPSRCSELDSAWGSYSTKSNESSNSICSNIICDNSISPHWGLDAAEQIESGSSHLKRLEVMELNRNSRNQSPLSDMNSQKSSSDDDGLGSSDDDEDEDDLVIEEGYEELPILANLPLPCSMRDGNGVSGSNDKNNNNTNVDNIGSSNGRGYPVFSLIMPSDLQTR